MRREGCGGWGWGGRLGGGFWGCEGVFWGGGGVARLGKGVQGGVGGGLEIDVERVMDVYSLASWMISHVTPSLKKTIPEQHEYADWCTLGAMVRYDTIQAKSRRHMHTYIHIYITEIYLGASCFVGEKRKTDMSAGLVGWLVGGWNCNLHFHLL